MTAFTLNQADLAFILRQIKIAEAHAAGTPLTEIYVDVDGNIVTAGTPGATLAIPDPHVPTGLRTVDGSFNNIVPGREEWGAADNAMPRILDPNFRNDADGDTMVMGPPSPGVPAPVTNTDYSVIGTPTGGLNPANGGHTGNVADADPRIISNLIVDMSINNPAAISAWFNNPLALAAWEAANPGKVPVAPGAPLGANGQYLTNADLASIPNISPDEGLSKPFNGWMTFFGQFFDHGLDLISKGGNGTIFIPLQPDDPLITHGPDGIAGSGDEVQPQNAFMVLTRSTPVAGPGADGVLGTADDTTHETVNTTTPFVDQNQTYTSHASHQVFLREYVTVDGKTVATGNLLNGATGGLPTWADVKEQAREFLGIALTDRDVGNIPLLRTDAYGKFIPFNNPNDPADLRNGYAQVITGLGTDGIPNTSDDIVVVGTPDNPINTFGVLAIRTNHAFLDDIAHNAVPVVNGSGVLQPDADTDTGNEVPADSQGRNTVYDNELLDRHFITGDGRGNENIGLTTVHHIFHSEHNRQVAAQQLTVLQSGDLDFINEWLVTDLPTGTALPTTVAQAQALAATLNWDGERLFQAARFATEMQYQHLVFEEFARKVQPAIDPFVFNSATDINPAIFAEFAHTVYRFGHSMLTDGMPRLFLDPDGTITQPAGSDELGLIEAFLNPVAFDLDGTISPEEAAGSIVRGMVVEHGNEIDEFIVNSLRNNLLGLPLDLASINIARGRDTGVPTLNDARAQLYAATGSSFLKPYDHWVDFAANLKNSASVINFIAAYGTHSSITLATTLEQKRDAATLLVMGNVDVTGDGIAETAPADRVAYLTGTGTWAGQETGLGLIDLWIGGLAEKQMPFGGMLGSTFNAVFEAQLENLQDGDRFYYLTRTQGQNFLHMLEQNSFAKMIMANTDISQPGADGIRGTADDVVARHIGVDAFAKYDLTFEINKLNQMDEDPVGDDPILEAIGLGKVLRDDPGTVGPDANYFRFHGGEHVLVGGTNDNDTIITDDGDDGIWGDGGDDRIESGAGVDLVNGGAGNDIITDSGDTGDFIKGDEGDDVIANSNGIDILMGGSGRDVIYVGVDDTEVFGGTGDDFVLGGDGVDLLMGNEGDDWLEAGAGFDTTAGDNSELFFNSTIIGHDVMFAGTDEHDFDGESGDDIMVQGESVIRNEGMFGFDWAIFKGVERDAYADMNVPIFTTEQADILRNRFDKTEALSGWKHNDTLIGDSRTFSVPAPGDVVATTEGVFFNDGLNQAGIDRIAGLGQIVSVGPTGFFESGNILLGGAGSDSFRGNGGDDILDGDRWLNVRIRITGTGQTNTAANQIATVDSLKHTFGTDASIPADWRGRSLFELLIARVIVPSQLYIVREVITTGASTTDVDVANFNDVFANYTFSANVDGSIVVTHAAVSVAVDPLTGQNLVSDGVDTLRNMERLAFADAIVNVIIGTPFNDNGQAGAANRPVINGTANADIIMGLAGNDTLNGLGGNDILIGGPGNDTLNGGAGDDTYAVAVGDGSDTIQESSGADTLSVSGTGVALSALNVIEDGNTGDLVLQFNGQNAVRVTDHFSNPGSEAVETITFGDLTYAGYALTGSYALSSDTAGDRTASAGVATLLTGQDAGENLVGDTGNDLLFANGGDDALNGGAGADLLAGGAGNDSLVGGLGADVMLGGTGNDTYDVDDVGDVVTEAAAAGTDVVQTTLAAYTLTDNVENLTFTGAGAFAGTGNALNNVITGGAGVDTLTGLGGNDTYVVTAGDQIVEAAGGGIDTVQSAVAFTLANEVENLTLTGNGSVAGTGNVLGNAIVGNGGGNALSGLGGADFLIGNGGADTLSGGDASDWLNGGADNDTLDGGTGDDVLIGGAGNDTINMASGGNDILVYNATGAGNDTVNNFDADATGGQDRIDLSGFGITAATLAARVTESTVGGAGNTLLTITDANNVAVGTIRLNGVTNAQVDASDYTLASGTVINGTSAGQTTQSNAANETINGNNGNDNIVWGVGDGRDIVNGGAGTDTFTVNGNNTSETFRIYTRSEALAAIPGLVLAAGSDIVVTRAEGAGAQAVIAELANIEEIDVNPSGGTNSIQFIGDFGTTGLSPNTLTINGDSGDDIVDITALTSAHRIVFRSNGGHDTVIGDLRPQDVVAFAQGTDLTGFALVDNGNGTQTLSNGTNSITFTGSVPQLQNTPDNPPNDEGVSGAFEYTPSDIAGLKALVNGQTPESAGDDDVPVGVRTLSGHSNNAADPDRGAADTPFIRITDAHYGAPDANGNLAVNPIFAGLDPRHISNILGAQEANLPKAADANIFFMAFGQYFDHGLDFIGKGGNGTIRIGDPGGGAPGSNNPADLTRGTVAFYEDGVPQHINKTSPFVDQNQAYGSNELVGQFLREGNGQGGLGAHLLQGAADPSNPDFRLLPNLRELILHHWENNTVFHSSTLAGGSVAFQIYFAGLVTNGVIDGTMLPAMTSNFMGSAHALLLDTNPFISLLDHYVAGDGRANENFALTSMHTIWARNHNHHVEGLQEEGFVGTAEELFQAAKMINEAEYQRVVFTEFADMLIGGMRGDGTHGFVEYHPEADASISHEFAAAVYRVGHSLIGQTMTVIDENGQPKQVALFDAFLNPTNDPSAFPVDPTAFYQPQPGYEQLGVNSILKGTMTQQAEEVDFNIVDAVRNDLVRINADLFAFNVARGWDVGLGTLNQVRMDLMASQDPYVKEAVGFAGNLSPYTSWDDFQARNGLGDTVINQFKQAYPDLTLAAADIAAFQQINPGIQLAMQQNGTAIVKGIDRVDLWVGGLAETHINDGVVGQTFWVVLHEQFDRLQEADRFYYINRFDDFDFYENFVDGQEFADIVARNTGMTDLPEHLFETDDIEDGADDDDNDDDDTGNQDDDDEDDDDTGNNDDDDDEDDDDDNADDDDDEDDDGSSDDDDDDTAGNDDDDDVVTPPPSTTGVTRTGTPLADVLTGGAGDDNIVAFAGDDVLVADAGDDAVSAAEGNDFINGGAGRDVIFAGAGDDQIFAGSGADIVFGDAGADRIFADAGNDMVNAGAGDDTVFGGAGNDLIVAELSDGNDVYFGDDADGGSGVDTLDVSAATANVTVNLGNGPLQKGSVSSSQTGNDTIWGIENVNTGSGNDTITASNAVNVMNGGSGNDVFKFLTAAAANGDTVLGFEPGDRVDLSAIDANTLTSGDQAFTLISGAEFTAAGQLAVTFESRADGDFTVVQGNIDGNTAADFKFEIEGHHVMTNTNLTS